MNKLTKQKKRISLSKMLRVVVVSLSIVAALGSFLAPARVAASCSAQTAKEDANCEQVSDCKGGDISEANCGITHYLKIFINTLSALVGVTVVAVLVMGGIQYSTSAGDPNAAAAAKQRITNGILALVAFGMMYGFLQWLVPGGVF